ncbi:DMT family transporter [Marinobacterium jannaschii]|uniref:DMT family transporter n=1 Tax=Marinobacterium jannaschii TaxID=64970 RepID=UPI000488C9FB|nr:multidrug efflux SMR transporter [Marinobacterium jannaschii]
MQHWLYLLAAILLEVGGTTAMKYSEGFSRLLPSVLMFVCYGLAFVFLTYALKVFEVGTAYAIWSGVGTAAIALIGVLCFSEAVTTMKLISLSLIILGVVGLNLAGGAH